jgi:hypothetical protein
MDVKGLEKRLLAEDAAGGSRCGAGRQAASSCAPGRCNDMSPVPRRMTDRTE